MRSRNPKRLRRAAAAAAVALAVALAWSAGSPGTPGSVGSKGKSLQPSELGYFGGLFSSFGGSSKEADVATFDREPARGSLTAPPSGYQTPSAAQPYGITKKDPKLTVTPVDRAVGY